MAMRSSPLPPHREEVVSTGWTWLALIIALIGAAGTLYLSIADKLDIGFGMELLACPLCFYQRTLMLAVATVLLVGLFAGPRQSGYLTLVTFPLTVAGLGIGGWHIYLESTEKLKCPTGAIVQLDEELRGGKDSLHETLKDLDTAPRESLTVFALLFLVQLIDLLASGSRGGYSFGGFLVGLILGGALAAGAITTAGNCRILGKDGQPLHLKDFKEGDRLPGCLPVD